MRKKKVKLLIIIITFPVIYMLSQTVEFIIKNDEIAEQIQILPVFSFCENKTGKIYTDADIVADKFTLIVLFHPECEICHKQIEELKKGNHELSNCLILLISSAPKDSINSFTNKYNLVEEENIKILSDEDYIFDDIFGKTGTPATFIYNKNRKLVKQFKGLVTANELIKYLEE